MILEKYSWARFDIKRKAANGTKMFHVEHWTVRFRWHLDSNSLNGPIFSREVKNAFWNLTDSTLYNRVQVKRVI